MDILVSEKGVPIAYFMFSIVRNLQRGILPLKLFSQTKWASPRLPAFVPVIDRLPQPRLSNIIFSFCQHKEGRTAIPYVDPEECIPFGQQKFSYMGFMEGYVDKTSFFSKMI